MQTLLIVDDEKNVLYSLEKGLKGDRYVILTADTAKKRAMHVTAISSFRRTPGLFMSMTGR